MRNCHVHARGLAAALSSLIVVTSALAADVSFYPVGQLQGGVANSQIRDAVFDGDSILAVGFATQNPKSQLNPGGGGDTAVKWTLKGGLQPLPMVIPGMMPPVLTRNITASAIAGSNGDVAYRSMTDDTGQDVIAALATRDAKDLNVIGPLSNMAQYGAAVAVSANGKVVYGFNTDLSGHQVGFRWTAAEGITALGVPPGSVTSPPAGRATTADGSIVVGGSPTGPGGVAYIYRHGEGIKALPVAAGGTWTGAIAITPYGHYIAGTGDSTAFPNGQFLIWHDGKIVSLGLPGAETGTNSTNFGGLTLGGKVLVTFDNNTGYFHNSHGWFNMKTVIAAAGVNLSDWTNLLTFGVSSDGRLVFGSGFNSTGSEGFVVKFPEGYLRNYGKPSKAADEFEFDDSE